jgi:hypothetical protein
MNEKDEEQAGKRMNYSAINRGSWYSDFFILNEDDIGISIFV